MKAFARPGQGTSQAQWWAKLKPLMTAEMAAEYAYVDAAGVPATTVTGAARVQPLAGVPQDLDLPVVVPTDAGVYVVHMATTQAGMLVAALEHPGGAG